MRTTLTYLALLLATLDASPAAADTDIRIGPGSGCSAAGINIQAAINAADPALGVTRILITRDSDLSSPGENAYSAQQLDINGKNVHLIGGYESCLAPAPTPAARTVISGLGGGSNSVVTIRGSTTQVSLLNLDITGGDEVTNSNGFGGGIDISGGPHPLLFMENVRIQSSHAGYGGGISIKNGTPSDQGAVRLVIGRNNLITQNTAEISGGGIYCENSSIEMVQPNSAINQNAAGTGFNDATGGGARLQNCIMRIATRSPIFGTVQGNFASGAGGGISITGERAQLTMFNLLPDAPTTIALNTAGGVGGGIDIGSSARVAGFDIAIDGNTSRAGGGGVAIFDNDGFNDNPAEFTLQGTLNGAPAGAVRCVAALDCNRLSNNLARSAAGTDQAGAAIRANGSDDPVGLARVQLFGTRLDHNAGRSLIHQVAGRGTVLLDGTLLDHNTATADLLYSPARGLLQVYGSTIAANSIADSVVRTTSNTQLKRSLVWQPDKPLLTVIEGSIPVGEVEYVLANNLSGAPANSTNRVVNEFEVAFVDAAADDFRLQTGSVAIDYAPSATGSTRDNLTRSVDIAEDSDQFGPQDIGAYEKQSGAGYNSAPMLSIAGPFTMLEDRQAALQGFSLSDPDGDINGGLYVTTPSGDLFGLYFSGVTATQLTPGSIVIEGPLSQITNDTATGNGFTAFTPAPDFFGVVPIELDLTDFGNTGFGAALWAHATLTVNVLPVNDAPTLQVPDLQFLVTDVGNHVVELEPLSTISLGPPNEADQSLYSFSLLSAQDSQQVLSAAPTLAPDGKLTFALSGNPGVAQLSARIIDGGGTENGGVDRSAPAVFSIRVGVADDLFSDGFEGAN